MTDSPLTAIALVCSLKPSPAPSSSELIAEHVCEQLRAQGVTTESVRCVDHSISPGVEADMGDGDEWPAIREKVLNSNILVLATPVWLGHASSNNKIFKFSRIEGNLSTNEVSECNNFIWIFKTNHLSALAYFFYFFF